MGAWVRGCGWLRPNWEAWVQEGTIDSERFFIVAETEPYDHCVFTVRADMPQEAERRWLDVLFSMRYDDPNHPDRFGFFEGHGP